VYVSRFFEHGTKLCAPLLDRVCEHAPNSSLFFGAKLNFAALDQGQLCAIDATDTRNPRLSPIGQLSKRSKVIHESFLRLCDNIVAMWE
jgi:hypothetical protein